MEPWKTKLVSVSFLWMVLGYGRLLEYNVVFEFEALLWCSCYLCRGCSVRFWWSGMCCGFCGWIAGPLKCPFLDLLCVLLVGGVCEAFFCVWYWGGLCLLISWCRIMGFCSQLYISLLLAYDSLIQGIAYQIKLVVSNI